MPRPPKITPPAAAQQAARRALKIRSEEPGVAKAINVQL